MREGIINFVTILGVLGIPTIFSMTLWCIKSCRQFTRQLNVLMKAQQAQMRRDLMVDYYAHMKNGYISERDLDDWEANYQAYHILGANGVLDDRREKLFALPSTPDGQVA